MKQEVSSFWYTPKGFADIGLMEILAIKSFIANGYRFVLYTYNFNDKIFKKLDDLFDDFKLKDANEIIPFKDYFKDDRGMGVAAFSDYFRFNLLYQGGGIWADLDMVCLNYGDLKQEYIFSQEIDEDENKPRITTSFLKFPKNSEFGKNLVQESQKIIAGRKIVPWGIIGPWFLAKQVKKHNLENFAWDYKQTCQIPWSKTKDFINKNAIFDATRPFMHLFAETWRANKMDKNYFYKEGIYANLLAKYQIYDLLDIIAYSKKNSFLRFIDKLKYKLKI
ncbi:hypothetical protein LNU06_03595 [Campylobacter sp. VicNov18]|uniref:glycosyltransferase n=1 Tax=Campylobacter bilis TaxID=2691918 RepID=UPI00130EEDA2|nr:glycosyltransferase [Campylobacter bilis]MPV63222.1 hypothetical protein [Campylobacter hepaticus]MBM0636721.1 hypothetical protein [Campylobacter bilis]MCC8277565.1 hypothetical protein [Campylobacter bilis]MCC8298770.1 hypothetical protein [Campylobacter bilis]MCC8300474.1 hypothetical protein [Campylobacter bilis]